MTRKRMILVVDDDEIHQYALIKSLQQGGYSALAAGDGVTGLRLAAEHKPDLVLLDINLPDVDGFTVCAQLKKSPLTTQIPVVFHSAVADTSEAKGHAQDVGASSFLSYPVEMSHLFTVIEGTIARSAHSRPKVSLIPAPVESK